MSSIFTPRIEGEGEEAIYIGSKTTKVKEMNSFHLVNSFHKAVRLYDAGGTEEGNEHISKVISTLKEEILARLEPKKE